MFSDFTYLDQAIVLIATFLFIIHRFRSTDNAILSWRALRRVELKSVSILLLLLSMVIIIIYDLIAAVIKYRAGFWVDPVTGMILTRPLEKYTTLDRVLFPGISVMMNFSWTLQCTALFLMTALWNHMSKAMLNKPFMSSTEFKTYAAYSVFTFATYPFLQVWYFFSRDIIVSALVPLILYLFQNVVLIVLTQIANHRFRKLLQQLPETAAIRVRIKYYTHMNNYLALSLLCVVVGLGAITVDSVTTDSLFFNKFLLDIFTKIFNLGFTSSFPIAIMIMAPSTAPCVSVGPFLDPSTPVSPKSSRMSAIMFPPKIITATNITTGERTFNYATENRRSAELSSRDDSRGVFERTAEISQPSTARSPTKSPTNVFRDTRGFFQVDENNPIAQGTSIYTQNGWWENPEN